MPLHRRALIAILSLLLAFLMLPATAESTEPEQSIKLLEVLNEGLPEFSVVAQNSLVTPEQALSYFVKRCREKDYDAAAHVLNLNAIQPASQPQAGAELAARLYQVMKRQTGFPFGQLPDRADGYIPPPPSQSGKGEKRFKEAFLLGTLPLEVGDFEIYLTRCKTEDTQPVWVFAAATVDEINDAYELFGPRVWERKLPDWLVEYEIFETPLWTWGVLVLALLLSYGLSQLLFIGVNQFGSVALITKVRAGVVVLCASFIPYLILGEWAPVPSLVQYLLLAISFCALVWLISGVLHYFSISLIRGEIDSVEDLDGSGRSGDKRTLTYLSVGRRLLSFVVLVGGMAFIALKIPHFETVGVGLLASAGVLSVLLGVAAQPIVGNFVSGLQIGVTRPIRVGDSIHYDGTWCYVEDITFMYVMCRTWDEMRLVIPLRHFTSSPFKSDSLADPRAMRTIEMRLDYNVDVQALREQYKEEVKDSELWDRDHEPELEVLEFNDHSITIRALAWSNNASDAWRLHCQIRERLLKYLQTEQPDALPKRRFLPVSNR